MVTEWFQAAGGIATAAALIVIIKNALVSQREAELRTRPWIGVAGVEPYIPSGMPYEFVKVRITNFGELVAPGIMLTITEKWEGEQDRAWQHLLGGLFPHEEREYIIGGNQSPPPRSEDAKAAKKSELVYDGKLTYGFGKKRYVTEFIITAYWPTGETMVGRAHTQIR